MAVGIGASLSNAVAGVVVHLFGYSTGFLSLAVVGVAAAAIFWLAMPETSAADSGGGRPRKRVALAPRERTGRTCGLRRRGILPSGEGPPT